MKAVVMDFKTQTGLVVGKFLLEDNVLSYEGIMDETAKVFLEFFNATYLSDQSKAFDALKRDAMKMLTELHLMRHKISELQGDVIMPEDFGLESSEFKNFDPSKAHYG